MLDKGEMKKTSEEVIFPKIKVAINKDNNFVIASFQSVTAFIHGTNSPSQSIAFNYRLRVDNNPNMASPPTIISNTMFATSIMNNSYQFIMDNLTIGKHDLELRVRRMNSSGVIDKILYVNQDTGNPDNIVEQKGLLIVYVYER